MAEDGKFPKVMSCFESAKIGSLEVPSLTPFRGVADQIACLPEGVPVHRASVVTQRKHGLKGCSDGWHESPHPVRLDDGLTLAYHQLIRAKQVDFVLSLR